MKKRFGLILAVNLLVSLSIYPRVYASHTDAYTFYVPFTSDGLAEFYESGAQSPSPNDPTFDVTTIETVVSISLLRSDGFIHYDHGEDGLEPNLNLVTQASTEVWGDRDPANGAPPGIPNDILRRGDVIVLRNGVPVPRNPAEYFYDGGDKIMAVGSALAVTASVWPLPDGDILFAGAWELYPTSRWDTDYVMPVGENVPRAGDGYTIVGFNIQAAEDDTQVDVDLDPQGAGEQSFVLGEGENRTFIGGVQAGAMVHASDVVQVHLLTKDPLSTFQSRVDTMLPLSQWTHDYLAPRMSDGDIWLYNRHPEPLVVRVETITSTRSITIPPLSAGRYPPLPEPFISVRTGAHLTSTDGRDFFGLVALDERDFQDWGYALVPIDNMTSQALIGWAPGYDVAAPPQSRDEVNELTASRVYVTALTTITIRVDYENDGTPDADVQVGPLEEVFIIDGDLNTIAGDYDMTRARLYTEDGPFVAVWGQDQDAPPAEPSIDVGTNIVPLNAPAIQKTYVLLQEGYACGPVNQQHVLRFKVAAYNDSVKPIENAMVIDNLPEGIEYRPGTTTIERSENPGAVSPIPDDAGGSPFPLDDPGYSLGTLPPLGNVSFTYDAVIGTGDAVYLNRADLIPDADPAIVRLRLPFRKAGFDVSKTLARNPDRPRQPGQVIDFNVTITNTGDVDITELPLRDEFDPAYLNFRRASVAPDATTPGVVEWTDLTTVVGDLAPGQVITLSLRFRAADPLPLESAETTNIFLAEGAQGGDGVRQAIKCGAAVVVFRPGPTPTPENTPTPTPTRPREREDTPTPAPTRTPTTPPPPPPTLPSTGVTPTPAVTFLPETGVGEARSDSAWPLVVWPAAALVLGWAVMCGLRGTGKRG